MWHRANFYLHIQFQFQPSFISAQKISNASRLDYMRFYLAFVRRISGYGQIADVVLHFSSTYSINTRVHRCICCFS
jgi:hypothetical protein